MTEADRYKAALERIRSLIAEDVRWAPAIAKEALLPRARAANRTPSIEPANATEP